MTGCVILLPIAITFYTTWWFIRVVDGFFSPIYIHLGINVFGLGFATSITFIFLAGVFMSSWLGASLLGLGELFIKKTPLVRHIYSASKQISAAISPEIVLSGGMSVPQIISAVEGVVGLGGHGRPVKSP
ncbi:hypothetical protein OsI_38335 [Oryza sativa Indica Group]|uniref:Uncharacterized protein n=1 Tax=Oryza sativa subsp. indica TaxID=39946 RepID=B8BPN5_ORYSI|nr:hypothetical protein OsI_38335 [Oryza sativa Indica Group]